MKATATKKATVLLTSAGVATAVNVITALRLVRDIDISIVAVDMNPLSAGLFLADSSYTVPPSKDPTYVDSLLEICSKEKVDLVFPLYSGEIGIISRSADLFRENKVGLMVPSPEVTEICMDKERFVAFLKKKRFSYPKTYQFSGDANFEFPLFLKPKRGSSSKNAYRIDDRAALDFYMKQYPESIVQEFIDGQEYTVDCLVNLDEIYACVPRSRINVKDGKSMIGQTVDHPMLVEAVIKLLLTIGMHGPCNVQCMQDKLGNLFFIEVNPRLAAGGLPLAVRAGANIPEMMLKLALGHGVQPVRDYRKGLFMIRYLTEVFAFEDPEGYRRV